MASRIDERKEPDQPSVRIQTTVVSGSLPTMRIEKKNNKKMTHIYSRLDSNGLFVELHWVRLQLIL